MIGQGYDLGIGGCKRLCPAATGHSLVTLLSLSVSVKDRPLHKTLGKSQIYYPEHILGYGHREDLGHGFRIFPDRLIGGGDGGGPCTTLSPGFRGGGLESQFELWPGPRDKRDVYFWGTQLGTLIRESPPCRYDLS